MMERETKPERRDAPSGAASERIIRDTTPAESSLPTTKKTSGESGSGSAPKENGGNTRERRPGETVNIPGGQVVFDGGSSRDIRSINTTEPFVVGEVRKVDASGKVTDSVKGISIGGTPLDKILGETSKSTDSSVGSVASQSETAPKPTEKPRTRVKPQVIRPEDVTEPIPQETPKITVDNAGRKVEDEYDPKKGQQELPKERKVHVKTDEGQGGFNFREKAEGNWDRDTENLRAEWAEKGAEARRKADAQATKEGTSGFKETPSRSTEKATRTDSTRHRRRERNQNREATRKKPETTYNPTAEEIGTAKKLLMRIREINPITMGSFTVNDYMREITAETPKGKELAKDLFEIKDTADAFRTKNPENPNPTVKDFHDYYDDILKSWKDSNDPKKDATIKEIERRIRYIDDMSGGIFNGNKPLSEFGL